MRNYIRLRLVAFVNSTTNRIAYFMTKDEEVDYFASLAKSALGSTSSLEYVETVYFKMNKKNLADALNYPTFYGDPCGLNGPQQNRGECPYFLDRANRFLFSGCVAFTNYDRITELFVTKSPRKKGRHG